MKILILAPLSNIAETKEVLSKTKKLLTSMGHSVNSDVLEQSLVHLDKEEENIVGTYNKINKSLKEADIVIAEISKPSSGIGYLIANALSLNKPALILFSKESKATPPIPLKASKSKMLRFASYTNSTIENIIESFMKEIKQKLDTKFILIISPEIDHYLEWASEFRRMHKAQVVRESVEAVMKKDKEYKAYLNSQ